MKIRCGVFPPTRDWNVDLKVGEIILSTLELDSVVSRVAVADSDRNWL